MKIKRLDIVGFKSFPERMQIPFSSGISAIVGPNGCGKSNIVDSIRWVMGEQSVKQLRGGKMEDVLFNGANGHQGSGMAEVTMVLANDGAVGPGPTLGPSEISITRRFYRSGDSDYLINKVPCRLKDITQLFMDTGMGTKAYAIIEQGRIGALVDAKPEDRRSLIDEAAGITRYKAQKREAERKIEATEQNLTHVVALMSETKRQINTLTRAARKAAQYKEFKTELRALDLGLTAGEMAGLEARRAELETTRSGLQARLDGLLTGLERVEVDLERSRLEIVEQEKASESSAAALYEMQNEYNTLKKEDEFLGVQQEENKSRQERLTGELGGLNEKQVQQSRELTRLGEETAGLKARMSEKTSTRESLSAAVRELKREHDLAHGRRETLAGRLSELRARMGRLEEVLAGHDRLARANEARQEEIQDEIAQLSADSAEGDRIFEALRREKNDLSARLEAARFQVGEGEEHLAACRAEAERLAAEGRKVDSELAGLESRLATLKDVQANFGWYPEGVRALMADPDLRSAGVIGPVAEGLQVPAGCETAVEAALGERLQYILVRDRGAAAAAVRFLETGDLGRCGFLSLADLGPRAETDLLGALLGDFAIRDDLAGALAEPAGRSILTRDGCYVGPNGLIVGGRAREEDRGLLERLAEIEELETRVEARRLERDRLSGLESEARSRTEGASARLDEAGRIVRGLQTAVIEVDKKVSGLEGRRKDVMSRLAGLNRALEGQRREADRLESEKATARDEVSVLESDEFDLTGEIEDSADEAARLGAELEAARERDRQAALEAQTASERLSNAQREADKTGEWLQETRERIAAKERDLVLARTELERLAARRQEISGAMSGFHERLARAEEALARKRREVDDLRSRLNAQESEARQARRERSQVDEEARKVDLELQENGIRTDHLAERIQNDYNVDLKTMPADQRPALAEDLDAETARERRIELRDKIEGLGEVNTAAISEHEALMERYTFYKDQLDDLTASIENLKQSIARINRTCKVRFTNTFKEVDQKLREIFPLLFEGGEAWLSLTDESDPLEAGVEIHVHPPGKKLTVMSLLSGGEKALVALALIFALYLIKPSPFCLLDEIDAPLDEANIDRFNRLLKKLGQSSQVIMITHNKRTMQMADTLYGVTMEEAGVSKMVSVNLSDIEVLEQDAQMVQAG
ncbi:MAG: chromosome segregation protein SMC [Proteobacteria bacterium]|nr:chromosome segregation protein SMC [Pseudomonadota bacterium]